MKKMTAVFAFLVVMAPLSLAWGKVELPESFKAIVPEYPGATVTLAIVAEDGAQVCLEVDGEPKAVADFYKKAMVKKGWKVEMEMDHAEGSIISLKKDGRSLDITAASDSEGKTSVVLVLSNE